MELQAVTGQLHMVNGQVQDVDEVPGILARSAPAKAARGRDHDFLFIHLTLTGRVEETTILSQDLLDSISRRFYQTTGSVTAALRRAIIEVNELLLRLNLSGTVEPREGALTCAALHNSELFMLQVGESLAMLGHNFGVERLPPSVPSQVTPLGRAAGLDVRYYHHRLQTGNMLLLADPRIAHFPTQLLEPALVDTEVELGLEVLYESIGDDTARLLLVEFTDLVPSDLPDRAQPRSLPEDALAMIPQASPRREPGAGPVTVSSPGTASRRPQPTRADRATTAPTAAGSPAVTVEATARRATSEAAFGLSRFTRWLAELLGRLRPTGGKGDRPNAWALPALLALVIPIVVAVIVSSVYLQRGRVRRFADIKIEMGQNLAQADASAVDPLQAREYYHAVLALAVEAESVRPGDLEIDRLRQQALVALDRLDNVTRLTAVPFYEYDSSVNLSAVVLQEGFNGGIYTLDAANNVIYLHETDESYLTLTSPEPQRVLFAGQSVGNQVVGTVTDMMWRPRGSAVTRDGLLVLDAGGTALTYYPSFADIRAVPLGFASEWQLPVSITTFDERLYVLDAGAREIWKYFPSGDGFIQKEDERSIILDQDADLGRVIDLDIYSEDGSLLLLYTDGRIRYYDTRSGRIQWDETHLVNNGGLTMPIVAPTAAKLVGRGLNASIFLADAGSGRIIQISRGGTVLAQYRAIDSVGQELFAQADDFAVAETPLRIFVAAGSTLYFVSQE